METHDSWQEELLDISLALEEEALILRYRAFLPTNVTFSSEIEGRLFRRLADYLMQHATDLRLIAQSNLKKQP